MDKAELVPFDAAEWVKDPQDVLDMLNDALASGDARYVAATLGAIARSEGMTKIADQAGVKRQALYRSLSEEGNPTLETLLGVLSALHLRLKCEADLKAA